MAMLTESERKAVDDCLTELPCLLLSAQLPLTQKLGYRAGKLSRTRNWCQFVDGDVQIPVCFPNSRGEVKTWKLFARFDNVQPPSWPWDKPERYERKKAQWMISGDDVWGLSYEDVRDWLRTPARLRILQRLIKDLQSSFAYSRQRYC